LGNWHTKYEKDLKNGIDNWIDDPSFENDVKSLFNQWNREDSSPPSSLSVNDWNKVPAKNWRIDMLVTWLALSAYRAYDQVYNNFGNGYTYNEPSVKDLTKKATAICMLALYGVGDRDLMTAVCCVQFDIRDCKVKRIGRRWLIVEEKKRRAMANFSGQKHEAKRGLEIIKHYKMNKQCYMGWPNVSMVYYTVDDKAPTGSFSGEDCITFNPNKLKVKRISHRVPNPPSRPFYVYTWKIVEGRRELFDFGSREDEAWQSLATIKKYGFTHQCFVGRPRPSMTYFRR